MSRWHRTRHAQVVAATPETVFGLLADVRRWPVVFGPTVHVEHIERATGTERFRLWALVGGRVRSWTSRRELDPAEGRIRFHQEHATPPIDGMRGEWELRPAGAGATEVVLHHDFAIVDDDPGATAATFAALDHNSGEELAALARVAGAGPPVDELVFSFEDVVTLAAPHDRAYAFVDRSDRWPGLLPHVSRVVLTEDTPGVQDMEMDTVTAGGHTHTTRSVRLCFPDRGLIVYKQSRPPALLAGHSGSWTFVPDTGGSRTRVIAAHQVAIDPTAVEEVLGAGTTVAAARAYLRDALGANSRATVAAAGEHAATGPSA